MKKISRMVIALILAFVMTSATVSFAVEEINPNKSHKGTVGTSARIWRAGYFDFMLAGNTIGAIATHAYAAAADWTLSATELASTLLVVSSGSGAVNIVAAATTGAIYFVRNTMSYAATIIYTSGGTGVEIASGKTAVVMYNGSAYVRVTADATH